MKNLLLIIGIIFANSTFAATHNCTYTETGHTLVIQEDVPEKGQATLTSGANSTVLTYTNTVTDRKVFGCYDAIYSTKTFWHPYYEINIEGMIQYGRFRTRCVGDISGSFEGFFIGEMQAPKAIRCSSTDGYF